MRMLSLLISTWDADSIATAMDAIVLVETVEGSENTLTHVRDESLLEMHVRAEDPRQRALLHELHHDPQLVAPVETVAHEDDVAVVAGLLQRELVADVHQLAQRRHLHRDRVLRLHVHCFIAGGERERNMYTVLKPPSPITSFRPK